MTDPVSEPSFVRAAENPVCLRLSVGRRAQAAAWGYDGPARVSESLVSSSWWSPGGRASRSLRRPPVWNQTGPVTERGETDRDEGPGTARCGD